MGRLGGHARAKYVTGTRLATSEERDWQNLLVERWRHSEGDLGSVEVQQTEVIVMLRGRLRVRRRGDGRLQDHGAVPGTVWLCPAGVREDMIRLYGDVEDSLHIYLPASLLAGTALDELDVDPDRVRLQYEGGFRDPLIEQIARAVCVEMAEPGPGGKMLAETLSHALRVHMLRRYSNLRPASVPLPPVRGALDARRLDRVKEFIDAHLGEDLSIDTLAEQACLSSYHFARAFKAATGMPPHRYVIERRIEEARMLVADGSLPLPVIADACGFSSQAHFTRWFKRILGVTPGAWRNR